MDWDNIDKAEVYFTSIVKSELEKFGVKYYFSSKDITYSNDGEFCVLFSVNNPNYEKELVEYNAWKKEQTDKRAAELRKNWEIAAARKAYKAENRMQRVLNKVREISNCDNISLKDKMKKINELIGEK